MGTSDKLINENERRQLCSRANWNYIFFLQIVSLLRNVLLISFLIYVLLMTIGGTDLFVLFAALWRHHALLIGFWENKISATLIILSSLCTSLFITTHSDQPSVDHRKKKMQVPKKAVHKTMMHEYVLLEGLRSYDGATTRGSVCHGSDCLECSQEMNCVLTFSRLARLSRL